MEVRHPELIALYASAPNHVLGQMLGLPGSCVLLPYVPLYHSALSAKAALGELLQLCPSSAGFSTSVEKAKTDCHDKARDWSLFGEVFESLKTYAA